MKRSRELTMADLVLLSLLAERPMHGYQANAELVRRQVQDWAGISRPQVYYSLEKLARLGLLRAVKLFGDSGGPEKRRFAITRAGVVALADALERESWTTQREKPAFLTWMALSWQARHEVFLRQLENRKMFLRKELERERATLASILQEVGHQQHEAVWMVKLVIGQFATELEWLRLVKRGAAKRKRAKHPAYAMGV